MVRVLRSITALSTDHRCYFAGSPEVHRGKRKWVWLDGGISFDDVVINFMDIGEDCVLLSHWVSGQETGRRCIMHLEAGNGGEHRLVDLFMS